MYIYYTPIAKTALYAAVIQAWALYIYKAKTALSAAVKQAYANTNYVRNSVHATTYGVQMDVMMHLSSAAAPCGNSGQVMQ